MNARSILACAGLATILAANPTPALAGDLQPPAGAIAPTMKALDAIEPRACVSDLPSDEGAKHLITQPGVYVFTADVVGENGKDGLRIDCNSFPAGEHTVCVMMQGFSLKGVAGAANAIYVANGDPANRRVHVVISGSVRGSGGSAPGSLITGWSVDGVHVEGATSVSVEGLRISSCGDDGFESVAPSSGPQSVRCFTSHFSSCGGDGVSVTLPATDASSLEIQEVECLHNSGHGARILYTGAPAPQVKSRIRVASVNASHNSLDGFRVSIGDESISYDFEDLRTASNGGHGTRMSIDRSASRTMSVDFRRCSSSGNAGDGYSCVIVNDSVNSGNNINWYFCSSSNNTGHGIYCVCPPFMPIKCGLSRSSCTGNGGDGARMLSADESIDLCDFSNNTGDGLHVVNGHVRCSDGSCRSNGGSGISISDSRGDRRASVDAMSCSDNGGAGIVCDGLDSLRTRRCGTEGNGGGGMVCGNTNHFVCDDSDSSGNAEDGLRVSTCGDVAVTGGSFSGNGTGPVGGSGISGDTCVTFSVYHLIAGGNTGSGGALTSCVSVRVESCDFDDNDLDGFVCGFGTSVAMSNSGCRGNTGNGITVSSLSGPSSLRDVTSSGNGGHGAWYPDCDGDDVYDECVFSSNGGSGLLSESTVGVSCGIVTVRACVTNGNADTGINLACSTGGVVRRCMSSNNGLYGVVCASGGHVIVENTCSSNTLANFSVFLPGNSLGPLVSEAMLPQNTNPSANYVR